MAGTTTSGHILSMADYRQQKSFEKVTLLLQFCLTRTTLLKMRYRMPENIRLIVQLEKTLFNMHYKAPAVFHFVVQTELNLVKNALHLRPACELRLCA